MLIQIEYLIAPEHYVEFLKAIHTIEPIRRRNGAGSWRVYRDLEREGRFVERFVIESWGEYTRLRTRATQTDRRAQERIEQFQRDGAPVRVLALHRRRARRLSGARGSPTVPASGRNRLESSGPRRAPTGARSSSG